MMAMLDTFAQFLLFVAVGWVAVVWVLRRLL